LLILEAIIEDKEDSIPCLRMSLAALLPLLRRIGDERTTAAEVLEDTQLADEERELEETFSTWQNYVCDDPVISSEAGTDALDSSIIDVEWVANATFMTEESAGEIPLLEEIFGSAIATPETEAEQELKVGKLNVEDSDESSNLPLCYQPSPPPQPSTFETLEVAVQSIEQLFDEPATYSKLSLPLHLSQILQTLLLHLREAV
jgi:hypothetical protein